MESVERKLSMITSMGKKYTGMVDVPSESYRTTDLINSSTIFWKDGNEKVYEDAIFMRNARLYLDDNAVFKKFEKVQIKINEIIYLYDDIASVGDETEKKRASSMPQNAEVSQTVNIITRQVANSFYDISGILFGFIKKKSKDAFIPLTHAAIAEISKKQDKWVKRQNALPRDFICLNNQYVESLTVL